MNSLVQIKCEEKEKDFFMLTFISQLWIHNAILWTLIFFPNIRKRDYTHLVQGLIYATIAQYKPNKNEGTFLATWVLTSAYFRHDC